MQEGREFVVADFSAGVGFDADLSGGDLKRLTDTKFARQAVNLVGTGAGSLRGRRGCSTASTSLTSFIAKRLAPFDQGPAAAPLMVDGSGAGFGWTNLSTGVRTAFAAGVIPANGLASWVQAPLSTDGLGPLFMQNGIDTPWFWSGAGNMAAWVKNGANATAIPRGGIMIYAANRIWIAGDPAAPSRLYYSSLNTTGGCDPGNFDSTGANDGGFIDLSANDGQAITALVPYGPYILAFKERKIFTLYDPAGGSANRLLTEQYGHTGLYNLGAQGVAATPFGVVFLADAGSLAGTGSSPYYRLFITDGSAVRPLGHLPFSPTLTASGPGQIKLIYFEGRLFVGGPSTDLAFSSGGPLSASNGCMLEYNFETDAWWIHQLARSGGVENFADAVVARAGDTKTFRLFGSTTTSGRLLKLFDNDIDGLDGTVGYTWKYVTPWYTLGTRLRRKRVDAVVLEPQAGTAVLESQVDLAGSWTVLDGVALPNALQTRYYTPAGSAGQGAGVLWSLRASGTVTTGRPNLAMMAFEYGRRSD